MSFSAAEEQVIYQTMNAPMRDYPFAHLFVENIFPDGFYTEILANLPLTSAYQPIGAAGSVGKTSNYKERYITDIPAMIERGISPAQAEFWNNMSAWLHSERFLKSILVKFGVAHRERFKNPAVKFRYAPEVRLVRDFENYAIGPHTDQPAKVVSLLFYLPADNTHSNLGTSIYRHIDPAFACIGGPHHPFDNFRKLYTAPYIPNSCLMFFKTARTFHGVEPIKAGAFERNVMLYNIYCDPVPELT